MNLHAAMRQLVESVVHRPCATQEIYNRAPYLAIGLQEFRDFKPCGGTVRGLAA